MMRHFTLLSAAISLTIVGCSEPWDTLPTDCGATPAVVVDAHAAEQGRDGAANIFGSVRFAPEIDGGASAVQPGTDASKSVYERTVQDVYVGGARVTQTEFNFRAWSVSVSLERLCAHANAEKTSTALPVRVYVFGAAGVCVLDASSAQSVVVQLAPHACDSTFDAGTGGGK